MNITLTILIGIAIGMSLYQSVLVLRRKRKHNTRMKRAVHLMHKSRTDNPDLGDRITDFNFRLDDDTIWVGSIDKDGKKYNSRYTVKKLEQNYMRIWVLDNNVPNMYYNI